MPHDRAPRHLLALAAALGLALAATGCVHFHHGHGPAKAGPPPWAPAHGHRHHHHGVELVFDAGLGVYGVMGWPGLYFHRDHYLRLHAGSWQQAARLDGPWVVVSTELVPSGLHRHLARGHGKHKHKGKGKHGH